MGIKARNMVYTMEVIFWTLSIGVLAVVFLRYTYGLISESFVSYAPYYVGFFGLSILAQGYEVFMVRKKNKNVSLLRLIPLLIAFFSVVIAGNDAVSGGFSKLIVIVGIFGFLAVFVKLAAKVYNQEKEKTDSKF